MTKEGTNARRVTFSKCQPGLFKKAGEVSTLCAVETALILLSPRGKPFYLGRPSVGAVLDRSERPKMACIDANQRAQIDRDRNIEEIKKQYAHLLDQLKVGKEGGKELDDIKALPFEKFSFAEFKVFDEWLEDVEKAVDKRRMELLALEASSSTPRPRAADASIGSQTDDEPRNAEAGNE
ncbi:agamous-like MADS-box protein AGL61 [Rhodamnia argentea]|uniref:Agamous-like MADS-box protein AGL61 n=1 Tax=Rhodamnia argentea TaxID=178133 RepID=A0A8B8R297_9MYRT|nr:agamous-like MADS-box protein AGL61 [Rhodamnia argentea]